MCPNRINVIGYGLEISFEKLELSRQWVRKVIFPWAIETRRLVQSYLFFLSFAPLRLSKLSPSGRTRGSQLGSYTDKKASRIVQTTRLI